MRTDTSVTEHPEKDIVGVRAIRERNRAERGRAIAIQNVVERLEVYGVLAKNCDIHPTATRDRAEAIVNAVLALTSAPTVQQ